MAGVRMYGEANKLFETACKLADVKTTRRQWKKWQRNEGSARKRMEDARKELEGSVS